ncbi:hypothetical protein ACVIGB_000724 [Bradyrhizobium sp. USDA 4341]
MRLSKPRRTLLETLAVRGGTVKAEQLTVPDRRLATRMQSDGLVRWEMPDIQSRHSCIGQRVTLTDAGREALQPTQANHFGPPA